MYLVSSPARETRSSRDPQLVHREQLRNVSGCESDVGMHRAPGSLFLLFPPAFAPSAGSSSSSAPKREPLRLHISYADIAAGAPNFENYAALSCQPTDISRLSFLLFIGSIRMRGMYIEILFKFTHNAKTFLTTTLSSTTRLIMKH